MSISFCRRCEEDKEFGGYAVTEGKSLCRECWDVYIELRNRQNKEMDAYWSKRDVKKSAKSG